MPGLAKGAIEIAGQGHRSAMSKTTSAGLVLYRIREGQLEFLLVHPGGPFWKNKDDGAWSIPKGELRENEDALLAAQREFEEEVGARPQGKFIALTPITQKGGKRILAWAFEGDCDPRQIRSNLFTLEWPPRSGKQQQFPEIDVATFFTLAQAQEKINPGQFPLLQEVAARVARQSESLGEL
jgi:predicted NUDIX family NTP pyrophosphohydrolase